MKELRQLFHDVRNALYTLGLSYDILGMMPQDAPPVMIHQTIKDSREAMARLQIAHDNYLRAHEEKVGKK